MLQQNKNIFYVFRNWVTSISYNVLDDDSKVNPLTLLSPGSSDLQQHLSVNDKISHLADKVISLSNLFYSYVYQRYSVNCISTSYDFIYNFFCYLLMLYIKNYNKS